MAEYEIYFVRTGARGDGAPETELVSAVGGADAISKFYQRHQGERVLRLAIAEMPVFEEDTPGACMS